MNKLKYRKFEYSDKDNIFKLPDTDKEFNYIYGDFLNKPVEPKEDMTEHENLTTENLIIDEDDEIDIIYDLDKGVYDDDV